MLPLVIIVPRYDVAVFLSMLSFNYNRDGQPFACQTPWILKDAIQIQ